MRDVYFASDSYALTGPSIVNKYYREILGGEFEFFQYETNPIKRFFKSAKNIFNHRVIVFSGASKYDYALICLAKILRRKTVYIMHGCIKQENIINRVERADETRLEKFYLKSADAVFCVSERFAEWVKDYYPEYSDKIHTLTNGIDWCVLENQTISEKQTPNSISIVGGGVPRKNVKTVCEAISRLITETGKEYELKVFGRDDIDTPTVKSYPFVKYFGKIERDELFKEISKTEIFMQNSIFDSFAMAPLEALFCGCSIICSANVGALSLFKNLEPDDVIEDCFDADEIKEKIAYITKHPNHDRLVDGLNKNETSFEARAEELKEYIYKLIKGQKI